LINEVREAVELVPWFAHVKSSKTWSFGWSWCWW